MNRRGFTLVELLIALAVLAVTMTATFTVFSSGLKLRSEVRNRLAFHRDARLLATALADDLGNLIPAGPLPRVSPDGVVLWRRPPLAPVEGNEGKKAQLVAYRWAGWTDQDSLLVRLSTELDIDIADSALVELEFSKWAGDPDAPTQEGDGRVCIDPDGDAGSTATLNGLSGAWVGFPRIKACEFTVTRNEEDPEEDRVPTLLQVHLLPQARASADRERDVESRRRWGMAKETDLVFGFWLPWQVPALDELPTDPVRQDWEAL